MPPPRSTLIASLFLANCYFKPALSAPEQQCYFQDGNATDEFTVCNATADRSNCCDPNATCLSNGLCYAPWDTSINTGACTDKYWKSPNCFQLCPPGNQFSVLFRCTDGWCCSNGPNSTSCCQDPGVDLFPMRVWGLISGGQGLVRGLRIANVSDVDAATGTVTTSAAAKPESTMSGGEEVQKAWKVTDKCEDGKKRIGLGVGVGAGVPLLAALGAVVVLWWRQRRVVRRLEEERVKVGVKDVLERSAEGNGSPPSVDVLPAQRAGPQRTETQRSKPWVLLSRSELAHDDSNELSAIG